MAALADDAASEHAWDRDDYYHFETIVDQPKSGMSDTDFDWLLGKLTESTPPPGAYQRFIDADIIGAFHDASLTTSQIQRADTAVLPLLTTDSDPGDINGLEPEFAAHMFVKYPDKRAVPGLLMLMNSVHPMVRRQAAKALDAQGYNVPIPPKVIPAQ